MRLSKVLLGGVIALALCEAAHSQQPVISTAKDVYNAAKLICVGSYGRTRPLKIDQGTLKYYCGRLLHPESWLQDQEWWKRNAPALLQAPEEKPRVQSKPLVEPPQDPHARLDEFARRWEVIQRCRRRGGSESLCNSCVFNQDSEQCRSLR
jgi:hypothetical protein